MKRKILFAFSAFSLFILASGCAFTHERINLNYIPEQGVAAVEGADQVRVAVSVSDNRTIKHRVGNKKNGWGIELGNIISNDDVGQLLSNALSEELKNRGFKMELGSVTVGIDLTRFLNDFKTGFFAGSALGEIFYTVRVDKSDGSIAYSRAVVGIHDEQPIFIMSGSNAKKALEGALKNAVATLMQDEEFMKVLTRAGV